VRAASSSPATATPLPTTSPSPAGPCGDGPAFAQACDVNTASTAAEDELKQSIKPYLDANPGLVVSRVVRIVAATVYVAATWLAKDRNRGAVLRDAVAELGPVFVKLGKGRQRGERGGRPVHEFRHFNNIPSSFHPPQHSCLASQLPTRFVS
jgi:hypothetical protein